VICKVQRSLNVTGRVLVYPQDRSFVFEGETWPAAQAVLGKDNKIYVEGHVASDGRFVIERRVSDQPW
jgi:hypothetical protein